MTEQLLRRIDSQRPDPPAADLRTRAAVTVAMALRIPAFQAHISRSIGTDILSPEGDQRIVLAVLDIRSHPRVIILGSRWTRHTTRQACEQPQNRVTPAGAVSSLGSPMGLACTWWAIRAGQCPVGRLRSAT